MPSYDNKVLKGERLAQFWTLIAQKIKGWISPKQDHTLIGTNDASKVLVTDADKKIVTSTITSTELGYLSGASSNIQTQLDDKMEGVGIGGTANSFKTLTPSTNLIGSYSGGTLTLKAAPFMGSVQEATSTAAKTARISDFSLGSGVVVVLRFRYDCGASATLNINSTGAKSIRYKNAAITAGVIHADDIAMFVYTDPYYELIGVMPTATTSNVGGVKAAGVRGSAITTTQGGTTAGRYYGVELDSDGKAFVNVPWTDTTYTNEKLGQGFGSCSTAAATVAKTVSLTNYVLVNGGIVSVLFENSVPANATLNVNSTGAKSIYFHDSPLMENVIEAGMIATFMYDGSAYQLIALDNKKYQLPMAGDEELGGIYVHGTIPTSGIDYFDGFIAEGGHLMIPVANPTGPGDVALGGAISADDIVMLYNRAPLASPTFTGHPQCSSTPSSNYHLANKQYVDTEIASAVAGATQFQGTVSYPDTDTANSQLVQHGDFKAGQYWLVSVSSAQTIAGQVCEAGDLVYCISTHSHTAGTAITASNFTVVQNNVDFLTESEITTIVALVS